VYLVIMVTCMFLLDKLGCFVDTDVFSLLLPMSACYLAGRLYFDILWLVPWLCCFVHYYSNDVGFLVLFADFLVGV
jgi:hypothetical protein